MCKHSPSDDCCAYQNMATQKFVVPVSAGKSDHRTRNECGSMRRKSSRYIKSHLNLKMCTGTARNSISSSKFIPPDSFITASVLLAINENQQKQQQLQELCNLKMTNACTDKESSESRESPDSLFAGPKFNHEPPSPNVLPKPPNHWVGTGFIEGHVPFLACLHMTDFLKTMLNVEA